MFAGDGTNSRVNFSISMKPVLALLLAFASGVLAQIQVSLVRGPYLQSGTPRSVVVRWRTDLATNSMVRFGTNALALNQLIQRAGPTNEHIVLLSNLRSDTRYYFQVGSTDGWLSSLGWFQTSPTNTRPVNIWVIGDSGTATSWAESVRDSFVNTGLADSFDLWLMLGDNAYSQGTDEQYQAGVFDTYPDLLRRAVVWPTIGNHDAASTGSPGQFPYLDIFTLPTGGEAGGIPSGTEKYYSFDYANIHFVCLDSQSSSRTEDSPMFQWLRADLADTDKDWIVAFWHHPPYSKGTHDSDSEYELIEMREQALPILEAYGVDLVLCGHSHVYERSYLLNGHYGFSQTLDPSMILDATPGRADDGGPYRKPAGALGENRGTVYVVCGNSGQYGGFDYDGFHPAMLVSADGLGSMILRFDNQRLDVQFLRPSGSIDDYFTLDKSQPGETRPILNVARSTNGATLSWPKTFPVYALESAPYMATNSPWQTATNVSTRIGRTNIVNLNPAEDQKFFRLRGNP
jgi:3',5'-cyclic AMP phosphodiesterase CpdA